jgi:dihydroorotate dehydrogenase electron transfer subunit
MNFKILENKPLSPDYYQMLLDYPGAKATMGPGQFFMVRVCEDYDPLLRRPFSVHYLEENRLGLLYQVVGKGTRLLTRKTPGQSLDLLGPLGSGFLPPPDTARAVAFVAGGIGIAPFLALADKISSWSPAMKKLLFYGARSQAHLVKLSEFKERGVELHLATEDGTKGHRGLISEVLKKAMPSLAQQPPFCLYACGPKGMLMEVAALAEKHQAFCQVSIDRRMACGTGVCMGCVVPVKDNHAQDFTYSCACKEGPVYPYQEIRWDLFAGQEIPEEK